MTALHTTDRANWKISKPSTDMGKNGKNSFLVRLLSGIVLFIVVVAAILISRYSFLALLYAIGIGTMLEFYKLADSQGINTNKALGLTTGLMLITSAFLLTQNNNSLIQNDIGMMIFFVVMLLLFATFIAELFRKKEKPFVNIAITICGVIYIALPLSLLNFISVGGFDIPFTSTPDYESWTLLSFIFIIWANDIGAYLTGIAIGKHKMSPRISPKKTWEGFIGGIIASVGIGAICGCFISPGIPFWMGLGLVASIFGVFGDLVESLIKRSIGIKDSGAIIPGHGGWLDRFDSLLIATPFVFIYFVIFALI